MKYILELVSQIFMFPAQNQSHINHYIWDQMNSLSTVYKLSMSDKYSDVSKENVEILALVQSYFN